MHEVLLVGDKLDRIDDTIVVQEHSSDLSGCLTILLLNDTVDVVTDFLASLRGIH